jgi:hypothetical protein
MHSLDKLRDCKKDARRLGSRERSQRPGVGVVQER